MVGEWAVALLIVRLALGLALFAHGTQKLFGWFGGGGIAGTGAGMESMGFRPGTINALLAGLGEAGGGLLLALGLLTPLGGAAVAATMIVAGSTHTANGFFAANGGIELPGFFGLTAVALTLSGPGQYSIDDALDYPLAEPWVGITALVVGVLAALRDAPHSLGKLISSMAIDSARQVLCQMRRGSRSESGAELHDGAVMHSLRASRSRREGHSSSARFGGLDRDRCPPHRRPSCGGYDL